MFGRNTMMVMIAAVAAVSVVQDAAAATVGVQLYTSNKAGYQLLAPGDSAGVVAQTNWNAVSTTSFGGGGSSGFLTDSTGNATSIKITTTGGIDGWDAAAAITGAYSASATGDGKLLNQISGSNNNPYSYEFTGLDPSETYDLYIYFAGNQNDFKGSFGVNGATVYGTRDVWAQNGSAFSGSFAESTDSLTAGSFAKFASVQADSSGNLLITRNSPNYWEFAASGLQLVSVPEPTALGLLGLAGMALVSRRRKA